jgi:RNA polymerase sigma-70 factor (ECF subfamily)
MTESTDTIVRKPENPDPGAGMTASDLGAWFIREVFPLEATLMSVLQRYWQNESDLADLKQEVYLKIYEAAKTKRPDPVKPYLLTVARNVVIDKVRKDQVVPIEAVADLESMNVATDVPGPERQAQSREELRRLQSAIGHLPPRYREVIVLAQVEGLSGPEIAQRMGITRSAVSHYLKRSVRALADMLYGENKTTRRQP